MIQLAYGVEQFQVTGGANWLTSDWYFIEAKSDNTDASAQEMTAMLKSLLADRFRLMGRQETTAFDVYDLVVDKGGPKLKPLAKGERFHCTRDNTFVCGITSPAQLADTLSTIVGRPVIYKTEIEGRYEILLGLRYLPVQRRDAAQTVTTSRLWRGCYRNSWDFGW